MFTLKMYASIVQVIQLWFLVDADIYSVLVWLVN